SVEDQELVVNEAMNDGDVSNDNVGNRKRCCDKRMVEKLMCDNAKTNDTDIGEERDADEDDKFVE
nr:hypothetical protein [Tanacetum cinerariifolium]